MKLEVVMVQRTLVECSACHGRKTLPVIRPEDNPSPDIRDGHLVIDHVKCEACDGKGMKFEEVP